MVMPEGIDCLVVIIGACQELVSHLQVLHGHWANVLYLNGSNLGKAGRKTRSVSIVTTTTSTTTTVIIAEATRNVSDSINIAQVP